MLVRRQPSSVRKSRRPSLTQTRRNFLASVEQLEDRRVMDANYFNLAGGNFAQDWSNAALITTNADWSGVPSILGFQGDGLIGATGVDPQTVVTPNTGLANVLANQTNTNITNGGLAEFENANPVVALQGSGTARVPHLILHMNTTGRSNVVLTFNARDIDGSADNAISQIAVQYRVGETGNYVNVPAGYIADASTGPSLATQVTPVSVTLPAGAENQAMLQIRILTTDAAGSDEWIGIDDIAVTSSVAGPSTAPTISDVANQNTLSYEPTAALAFTVGDAQTAPGALIVSASSSNQSVVPDANITLGGSGANRTVIVRPGAATGTATITLTVTDGGGMTATDTFTVNVVAAPTLSIPKNLTGNQGTSISIPVMLNTNGIPSTYIEGIDLAIQYDPAVLTVTGISLGSALVAINAALFPNSPWSVSQPPNIGSGVDLGKLQLGVISTSTTPMAVNGEIVIINATINGAAPVGTSPLNLVRTHVINGATKFTEINENGILMGPVPTSASNDPISDGVLTVGLGTPNNPPVNTVPGAPVLGTEDVNVTFPFPGMTAIQVADADAANTLTTTVSVPSTAIGTFTATNGGGTATITTLNGGASVQIVGSATNVNLALATLTFIPAAHRSTPESGVTTVTVATNDGTVTDTDTFNVTLVETNDVPTVGADPLPAINEDSAPFSIPIATLLANDSAGPLPETAPLAPLTPQTITFTSLGAAVGGTVSHDGTNVTFTPTPNYSGPASFTYTITDNGTNGGMPAPLPGTGTVSFTINAVNDVPSFTVGPNQVVSFNSPAQTVTNWATNITAGPSEGGQTLTFVVQSNSNGALFTAGGQPAISDTGTLTYTPAPGASGTANIVIYLQDDGGNANGGVFQSPTQSFSITVNSAGNAPTINAIGNVTINEDAGLQTVNFSGVTDGGDTVQQAITISASSNNPTLIPNPTVTYTSPQATGSLAFTPVANQSGTATITVTVRDSGLDLMPGNADDITTTTMFNVTVNAVNDPPTIDPFPIQNFIANEDEGGGVVPMIFTGISAGGGESQTIAITATSNNLALLPNPTVSYISPNANATITSNLVPDQFGAATMTVTVRDAGADGILNTADDATTTTTVNFDIQPVNDAPTISIGGNQSVPFNAPAQTVNGFASVVSVGPANETGQTVTYLVSNNNNSLFSSQPSISSTGVLTYTPAAGQQGTATVSVQGQDSGGTANGGVNLSPILTFTITVNAPAANVLPTINPIGPVTINEDVGLQIVNLSGISAGGDVPAQSATVSVSSSNPTLIPTPSLTYTSPATTGSLSFTPAANASGNSTITVTVRDNGLDLIPGNADDGITTTNFVVTINAVNDQPTFSAAAPPAVNEDSGLVTVNGFITAFNPGGGADEAGQTPTYNVSLVSNPSLFAVAPTVNAAGQLTYTPASNAFGTSTFQVTATDSGDTANGGVNTSAPQTFTINVNSVNDAPSFTVGPSQTVPNTASTQTIANWATGISAGPANEAGQTVNFTVTGNTNAGIFASGPTVSSNGTLTFTPAAGASGTSTITLIAVDNGGMANGGVDTSGPQSFTITVVANNPPTINPIGNQSINENAGPQTVNLSGITAGGESQALSVTASSSNPSLIAAPSIVYSSPSSTGTLSYTPALSATGSSTITVNVRDAGFDGILGNADDGTTSTSFTVTVNAVNDPPVANDSTVAAVIDTPVNGTLSATDPDGPTLTFAITSPPVLGSITSFNPATGAYTYTPSPGATGLDTFSFSVTDGEFSDTGMVRIAIQGTQPVVTPSGGDLVVIGTPDPDMIIITYVAPGVVRVRTDVATAHYPVTNQLIVNSGESGDYVVITGVTVPTTGDLAGGDDYFSSGNQDDVIIGGTGNDQINGSGGTNVIWGDNVGEQDLPAGGNDKLSSLGGNDVIYGGGGHDEIFPGGGNDYVNAGQGNDVVAGGAGDDRIIGGLGNDSVYGDEGNDIITGGGGSDSLVGRTGNDVLIGGLGADSLNGDEGADLLFGSDTSNSASSTAGDANDLALMAMLASWNATRPSGLASSVSLGNDGAPDQLAGYTGDDDLYVGPGDSASDFGLPFMGTDRFFSI